jgi:hypothetical protein
MTFTIDSEFGLSVLGVTAIILIIGTILLVGGVQTGRLVTVSYPCSTVPCTFPPAQEISRDAARNLAYCQCADGEITQMPLW